MDRNGNAHDKRMRNAPWRVRDGEEEEEDHFSNKHNPVVQVRSADIL